MSNSLVRLTLCASLCALAPITPAHAQQGFLSSLKGQLTNDALAAARSKLEQGAAKAREKAASSLQGGGKANSENTDGAGPVGRASGGGASEGAQIPGLWENTITMGKGSPQVTRTCVHPGESKDPRSLVAANGDCSYTTNRIGAGRIDLAGRCRQSDGSENVFSAHGTYGPTQTQLTLKSDSRLNGQPFSMIMTIVSRRVSPTCPGGLR